MWTNSIEGRDTLLVSFIGICWQQVAGKTQGSSGHTLLPIPPQNTISSAQSHPTCHYFSPCQSLILVTSFISISTPRTFHPSLLTQPVPVSPKTFASSPMSSPHLTSWVPYFFLPQPYFKIKMKTAWNSHLITWLWELGILRHLTAWFCSTWDVLHHSAFSLRC